MPNTPNNPRGHDVGRGTGRFEPSSMGSGRHESTREAATGVMDKAKHLASDVSERAQDAMSDLKDKASDVASDVGRKVTDTWEAGREYVTEHGFSGMVDDAAAVIRRNPIPSLLIGFGLGFILGRSVRD